MLGVNEGSNSGTISMVLDRQGLRFGLTRRLSLSSTHPKQGLLALNCPRVARLSTCKDPGRRLLNTTLRSRWFLINFRPINDGRLTLRSNECKVVLRILRLRRRLLPLVFMVFLDRFRFHLALSTRAVFLPTLLRQFLRTHRLVLNVRNLLTRISNLLHRLCLLFLAITGLTTPYVLLVVSEVVRFQVLGRRSNVTLLRRNSFFYRRPFRRSVLRHVRLSNLRKVRRSFCVCVLPREDLLCFNCRRTVRVRPSNTQDGS